MSGKEYQIAFELKAKLESSYTGSMRKVMDNLNNLETTARAIEGIRISGDMVRPLREGLQAVEREFDQLRRIPRIDGIFTETVKELKEAVKESQQLSRNLQEIARIRMPSNMFGNDLQRYTRDMQDLERRMREINDIQRPQPGDSGGGGGEAGGGDSSGAWALDGAALAGGAGVAVVGGLALAGHAVFSFSEEYQEAMNQLQASTNSSAEQMKGFSAIAENLYNQNMGEGFYDVAESMSAVRKVTQLTGSDLESTTKNAMVYADVFNEDISESVKAADTMMKNFGITSTEAYNLLAQGASGPLSKSMDLLDTANEYSVYFAKLGFSANQMFDTFAAGMEAGAFSLDKVGDGIKEFGIRTKDGSKTSLEAYKAIGLNGAQMTKEFNEGGKTAQEAFLKTAKAIKAIKNPVVANAVSVQLFGTQAEDLESRVVKAMTSAKRQFDMTKNTMEEIGKVKYNTIGQAFGGIGRTLQTSLILPISKKLLPIFSGLADKMTDWVPAVMGAFGKVGDAVSDTVGVISKIISSGFSDQGAAASINFLDRMGLDFSTATQVVNTVKSIFGSISGVVENGKKMFSGQLDIAGLFGITGGDMNGVISGFKDIFGNLKDYFSDFIGNLVGLWPSIQKMFGSVMSLIPKLLPIFGAIGRAAVTGFQAIYKSIIPIITYLSSMLWPIISKIFTFLSTQVFPRVASMIAGLVPPIMVVVGKAGEMLGSIGTAITRAFSVVKPVLDAVFAAFNFIWPNIKNVVMNTVDLIGGIIKGLLKSLGGIIDFVTGVFSGNWSKAWQGIKDIFSGIFDGLGAILTFPINVAIDAINTAIRGINKVSFDVPDWVPGIGGDTFGVSIPEIPKLGGYATGGYVDSPELAWVGEGRSPEWIIPENNSARSQGLLQAANRSMGGGNANTDNSKMVINYNPTIIIEGNADKATVDMAVKAGHDDFDKRMKGWNQQKARVSLST
ncbi:phage tail tape measure protein [Paenibacillus sp. HW567]|uniref:phage tail tape measure protein n=1 Tax=Paenibacillus sp. HW567 TaxID=1034769 RepID=UPI0003808153|nr:phage tail tape measure protein [Paenibacillus sp. HW567]